MKMRLGYVSNSSSSSFVFHSEVDLIKSVCVFADFASSSLVDNSENLPLDALVVSYNRLVSTALRSTREDVITCLRYLSERVIDDFIDCCVVDMEKRTHPSFLKCCRACSYYNRVGGFCAADGIDCKNDLMYSSTMRVQEENIKDFVSCVCQLPFRIPSSVYIKIRNDARAFYHVREPDRESTLDPCPYYDLIVFGDLIKDWSCLHPSARCVNFSDSEPVDEIDGQSLEVIYESLGDFFHFCLGGGLKCFPVDVVNSNQLRRF